MKPALLPLSHALIALAVVAVWGTNFVVIKIGLAHWPPLLFATLRFTFVLIPAIFFFKRPDVPIRNLAIYGAMIGAGQFGFMYIAINGLIAPGLASLVVQTQVFFTIGLAMVFTRESMRIYQGCALVLASSGLVVIGLHTGGDTTVTGLALVIGGAFCWGVGNIAAKVSGRVHMLAFVVWGALFSVIPLSFLSLIVDGPARIATAIATADRAAWASVLWQSVGNTLFGYSLWGWLLARHPAAAIAPISLLVPVFGMGATALLLGEPLPGWKLIAAALIMGGLVLNIFWPWLAQPRTVDPH